MSDLSKFLLLDESGVIDATEHTKFAGLHVSSLEETDPVAVTVTNGASGSVVFAMDIAATEHGQIFPLSGVGFPDGIYVTVSGDAYATLLVS